MRVGLSGHQKMPEAAYTFAANAIDDYLAAHENIVGVCSLAAGSDQLFAEKVVNTGNELHVVIPCKDYEATFDADGLAKYQSLLAVAANTEMLGFDSPSEEAFYAAGKRVAELSDELIAVWDGKKAQGLGGTADIVDFARHLGKQVIVVWPDGVER